MTKQRQHSGYPSILDKLGFVGQSIANWNPWEPKSEPQKMALSSPADIIGFGGSAGGGKTAIIQIMAVTQHRKSIVFRREYPRLLDIIEKSRLLLRGSGATYNSNEKLWRKIPGGRTLKFGAAQHESDIENWRGIEHDLKAIDEVTEFSLEQFLFLTGWCRSPDPHQKCRVIFTFNPPSQVSGRWIIGYLAPWLDPKYESQTGRHLAEPGELRWFVGVNGKDQEVDVDSFYLTIGKEIHEVSSLDPVKVEGKLYYPKPKKIRIGDEDLEPRSRTFIRATLDDNPFLRDSGYRGVLQSLPEPLRSQLLYGDMTIEPESDPYQVIPGDWVTLAMQRWVDYPQVLKMSHIGVDVARGGIDKTVLALRWDNWLDKLREFDGSQTPDSNIVAQQIASCMANTGIKVQIDVIGVGAAVHDTCRGMKMHVIPLKGSEAAKDGNGEYLKDKSGLLTFANMRTYWYWNLRDLLDPKNQIPISLPPDDQLKEELCAFRWWESGKTIMITKKDDIKSIIGRSPNLADAVCYAFAKTYREGLADWMKK